MIVAIDGPAGSGKSTVARAAAKECGFTYLDTGALYRCVALSALQEGADLADEASLERIALGLDISFGRDDAGEQLVFLNGADVSRQIRTPEVDATVPVVSALPRVRAVMTRLQRDFGTHGNVVLEGRDIGTVVFPQAELKIFLTASLETRALRRASQSESSNLEEVLEAMRRRDAADESRDASPLRPAEDAVIVDSTNFSIDETVRVVVNLIHSVSEAE